MFGMRKTGELQMRTVSHTVARIAAHRREQTLTPDDGCSQAMSVRDGRCQSVTGDRGGRETGGRPLTSPSSPYGSGRRMRVSAHRTAVMDPI